MAPTSTFIYWAGHGESTGSEHWLVTSDSAHPPAESDGIQTSDLARYLRRPLRNAELDDAPPPWTVVVLDCCGARLGVQRLARELLDRPARNRRRWHSLRPTAMATAFAGRFAAALRDAVEGYAENDQDIVLKGLLDEVAERLGPDADLRPIRLTREHRVANPRRLGVRLTASLDLRDELRRLLEQLDPVMRTHFVPKAQGAELGELAWYFTGRRQESRNSRPGYTRPAEECSWLPEPPAAGSRPCSAGS